MGVAVSEQQFEAWQQESGQLHRECGGLGKDFCSLLYTKRYMFVGKQVQILLILGFYEMKSEQAVSVATREA